MSNVQKEAIIGVVSVIVTHLIVVPALKGLGGLFHRGGNKNVKKQEKKAVVAPTGPSEDAWKVNNAPAPRIPDDVKEIHSMDLPCSVQDFYRLFVSSDFVRQLHVKLEKREDYQVGPWRACDQLASTYPPGSPCNPEDQSCLSTSGRMPFDFGIAAGAFPSSFIRSVTFIQPKKPPQSSDAECVQRQQFAVFKGNVLVLVIVQNMLNIPFKDCFTVNTCWLVQPSESGGGCTLRILLKVNFVKGCLLGGIIRMTTLNSNLAYFKSYEIEARRLIAGGQQDIAPSSGALHRSKSIAPMVKQSTEHKQPSWSSHIKVAIFLLLLAIILGLQISNRLELLSLRAQIPSLGR